MRTVPDRSDTEPSRALPACPSGMEDFYALRIGAMWKSFRAEHFSFWMICCYLFIEYVRPQSIIPALDVLPWAQTFLMLALLGLLADRGWRWVATPVNGWLIFFFFSILISATSATFPKLSWSKLADIYIWIIIYFLIINIVNTRNRFHIFISIFIIASFKISFSLAITWASRGFGFTTWGLMGPPGFFQNSGELAIQMAVYGPLALAVAQTISPHVSPWKRKLLYLMPCTAVMVILGSSSRGGQIALLAQLIFLFHRHLLKIRILIAVLLSAALIFYLIPPEQKTRFTEIGQDKTSIQRLMYWERGIEMLESHPVSGVGYYNFAPFFQKNFSSDLIVDNVELPHNIFIQVGSELGYLGLFAYTGLIIIGFKLGRDIRLVGRSIEEYDGGFAQNFGRLANVSLVGFVVAGQFVSVVYYPFLWMHLAFAVALKNIIDIEKNGSPHVQNV